MLNDLGTRNLVKNLTNGDSADIKITATNKIINKSRIKYINHIPNINTAIKITVLCETSTFCDIVATTFYLVIIPFSY